MDRVHELVPVDQAIGLRLEARSARPRLEFFEKNLDLIAHADRREVIELVLVDQTSDLRPHQQPHHHPQSR